MLLFLIALGAEARAADCAPVPLAAANRDARVQLDDQDPEAALRTIHLAEDALRCLDVLATREDLAALYQIGGTAALKLGDDEEARRLFTAGVTMTDVVAFDLSLGVAAANLYAATRASVERDAKGGVLARAAGGRLDGADLPAGQQLTVPPGAHLVQIIDASGAVRSDVQTVREGAVLEIGAASKATASAPARSGHGRHLGLAVGGATAVLAGTAALVGSGIWKNHLSEYTDGTEPLLRIDLLTFGGCAAVGVGTAALFTGAVLGSGEGPRPQLSISGRF